MNLMLRNKQQRLFISRLAVVLTFAALIINYFSGLLWNSWDYQVLDYIYSNSIENQKNAKLSSKIKFLDITDTSYQTFKKNTLDRNFLAQLNIHFCRIGQSHLPLYEKQLV